MPEEIMQQLHQSFQADDWEKVNELFQAHPQFKPMINEGRLDYNQPPLAAAPSVDMARVLLKHGADLQVAADWWNPGFNVIPRVNADVGRFLVEQGASVSPHAAAGMGLVDRLKEMIAADPEVVHAKGGDATRPIHFARTSEVADLLIEAGADLEAKDEDHDSTPVQWLIGSAPDVARHLVTRGARADIFLAAGLGDRNLAERLVNENPACLAHWIGKPPYHGIGHENTGGNIYQWSLGFNSFPHQIAAKRGHQELAEWMWEKSDSMTRLLVACVMNRRAEAEAIVRENPDLVSTMDTMDKTLVAKYCWETNADVEAVRLMLDIGFPVDVPENNHGFTPLHNAAWGGYADLVDLLLERGHPVDKRDPDFQSTPLGWAIYCCLEDGRHPEGEYGRVAASLIDAGCPWDTSIYPTGHQGLDEALKQRLPGDHS